MSDGSFQGARGRIALLAIVLSVSAALAYVYFRTVDRPFLAERIELHEAIVKGEAPDPYRYRVLAPAIVEAARRALAAPLGDENGFLAAYALFDAAAIFFTLWMLLAYLRSWFDAERALVGVLFAAATMPVALRDHYFQPWSLPEAGFVAAGLLCLYRRRYGLLAIVVAIASLNRETAFVLPAAYIVAILGAGAGRGGGNARSGSGAKDAGAGQGSGRTGARSREWVLGAALVAIWAFVFFGLRRLLGSAPPAETIAGLFARNASAATVWRALLRGALLLGAFWVFAALGLRRAPSFARRMALLVPVYLAPVALWGVWHEARLLLPLLPVILPLGLSYLFRDGN